MYHLLYGCHLDVCIIYIYIICVYIKFQKGSSYPLYHSKYETFYAVDKLVDLGFKVVLK